MQHSSQAEYPFTVIEQLANDVQDDFGTTAHKTELMLDVLQKYLSQQCKSVEEMKECAGDITE